MATSARPALPRPRPPHRHSQVSTPTRRRPGVSDGSHIAPQPSSTAPTSPHRRGSSMDQIWPSPARPAQNLARHGRASRLTNQPAAGSGRRQQRLGLEARHRAHIQQQQLRGRGRPRLCKGRTPANTTSAGATTADVAEMGGSGRRITGSVHPRRGCGSPCHCRLPARRRPQAQKTTRALPNRNLASRATGGSLRRRRDGRCGGRRELVAALGRRPSRPGLERRGGRFDTAFCILIFYLYFHQHVQASG